MGSVRPPKKPGSGTKSKSKSSSSRKPSTGSKISKPSSSSSKSGPKPKPTQQKTKRTTLQPKKLPASKRYSESQLALPTLNGIIPANAKGPAGAKPKGGLGKVKGKIFVDDAAHMLAIMGAVQAEAEGASEGRMIKARRLEEMRAEKVAEAEKRRLGKRQELEEVMDVVKKDRSRRRNGGGSKGKAKEENGESVAPKKQSGKKVSFG